VYTLNIGIVVASIELWGELQAALAEENVRVVLERREIGDWAAFLQKLDQAQPDVLLVDLAQLADPLEDVIRQIKATSGSPMVIVVHPEAEPATILRAIRSQADEFIYPPVKEDLHRALERMAAERAQLRAGTRPRGKILGFLSAKGGSGATTLTCHLAVELQRQTRLSVLVADYDIYGGVVGFLMKTQNRYSVLDAVDNVHRLDLNFWKALISDGAPGVEVIAAPGAPVFGRERGLEEFRDVLRFVRSNYDWTLVDLGRGLTPLVLAVLEEIDSLFLITTVDIPALHQAKTAVQALLDRGYPSHRLHLVLNRVPKRMEITMAELERMIGTPVYETIPNDYPALYDAYAEGRLLPEKSRLGRSFSRVAAKIAGRQAPQKRGIFFAGVA
jgi:pilus assembly protein CpaE